MNKHSKQRSWRRTQWLDKPHIPCGAITALVGRPGSGKTKIAFDIARRTASGHCDACGCPRLGGTVLFITPDTEEVKRMLGRTKFGGSTRRSLDLVAMQFPVGRNSVEILQRAIVDSGAELVVVDEFDNLPRGVVGSSKDHCPSDALRVLAETARSTNAAVLVLAKTTKLQDQHGLGAVSTGQELLGCSQSVLQVTEHPVSSHWRRVRHVKSTSTFVGEGWEIDLARAI